jgi:hypothetical protein
VILPPDLVHPHCKPILEQLADTLLFSLSDLVYTLATAKWAPPADPKVVELFHWLKQQEAESKHPLHPKLISKLHSNISLSCILSFFGEVFPLVETLEGFKSPNVRSRKPLVIQLLNKLKVLMQKPSLNQVCPFLSAFVTKALPIVQHLRHPPLGSSPSPSSSSSSMGTLPVGSSSHVWLDTFHAKSSSKPTPPNIKENRAKSVMDSKLSRAADRDLLPPPKSKRKLQWPPSAESDPSSLSEQELDQAFGVAPSSGDPHPTPVTPPVAKRNRPSPSSTATASPSPSRSPPVAIECV